jgi:uncharacterized membrane protein (UPF0182 family)
MSDPAVRLLKGGRIFITSLVAAALLLILGRGLSGLLVEVLWFRSAGYEDVFWTRMAWGWGVRLIAFLLTGGIIGWTLWRVAGSIGGIQIRRRFGNLVIQEKLPAHYIRWGVLVLGGVMGLWIAATIPLDAGIGAYLMIQAPAWGLQDPVLGRDASFYVFILPGLVRLLAFAILMSFLVFSLAGAGYVSTGELRVSGGRMTLGGPARRHLAVLGAVFLGLMALRFWLSRYMLLLNGTSEVEGIFGFTDASARLPALQFLTFVGLVSAVGVAWGGIRSRLGVLGASVAGFVLSVLVVGQAYPAFVQRFRVEPNELDRETPFIEHALSFTREGFGLSDFQRSRFDYREPEPEDWRWAPAQMAGLPVWAPGPLLGTFRQLEARFRYYDFGTVAIDRYQGPQGTVPVAISAREVDPNGIEDPNWQNLHIRERYVAGVGAVVSDATGATPEGRAQMFLGAIPPEIMGDLERAPTNLELERPGHFFGSRFQLYAALNPSEQAFLAPDGSPGVAGVDFPEGIQLSSIWRTLALAWRFRDANLLFASEVTDQSRFVFRRQVVERAQAIAPFLRFPDAPYPVIHDGRLVWMMDGYTSTRNFPLSISHEVALGRRASYVRGSVKATVDGVTGQVSFFAVDGSDPLLEAYRRVFPDLVRPLEEMPSGLQEHVRYPRSLLETQARVLTRFHLETAPLFHGQQDVWALAQELGQGTSPVLYRPEYAQYTLPGEDEAEFLLTAVFVPAGRQNLTGILVARSDPDRYGELLLFDVPVEDQVPGPRQVEALIEQDPGISQQFSLWRQGGSQVWTGHLHLVPAGRTLLYMEPIFLAAEEDAIPELRRFVVSDGRRVTMNTTLAAAIAALSPLGEGEGEAAEGAPLGDPGEAAAPGQMPTPELDWPQEALDLLEEAERRLRGGDWEGFGRALDSLKTFLRGRSGGPVS